MDRILLVTRNQSKHPDRGCAKASHDGRISGRGEFNRASPQKNVRKILDVIRKTFMKRLIKILPPGTIKSLTGDRGKEFAWYQKIENELRIPFYFADPHSPWQK